MIKYRATFEGPRGSLNPMGVKLPGAIVVEVFPHTKTCRTFRARTCTNEGAPLRTLVYENTKSEIGGPADIVKSQAAHLFDRQLTPWEMEEYA